MLKSRMAHTQVSIWASSTTFLWPPWIPLTLGHGAHIYVPKRGKEEANSLTSFRLHSNPNQTQNQQFNIGKECFRELPQIKNPNYATLILLHAHPWGPLRVLGFLPNAPDGCSCQVRTRCFQCTCADGQVSVQLPNLKL